MKFSISFLSFLFLSLFAEAQFPNQTAQSNSQTEVYFRGGGGIDSALHFRTSFVDTIAANRGFLKNIPGLIIRVHDTLFLRNTTATKWVNLSSGGSGASENFAIEDNTGITNRYNNFQNNGLKLDSLGYLFFNAGDRTFVGAASSILLTNGQSVLLSQNSTHSYSTVQAKQDSAALFGASLTDSGAFIVTPLNYIFKTGDGRFLNSDVSKFLSTDIDGNLVLESGGQRFGIEDVLGIQHRLNNMQHYDFIVDSIGYGQLSSQYSNRNGISNDYADVSVYTDTTGSQEPSSGLFTRRTTATGRTLSEMFALNDHIDIHSSSNYATGIDSTSYLIIDSSAIRLIASNKVVVSNDNNNSFQTFSNNSGTNRYIPLSVNGNYANSAGDISITGNTLFTAAFGSVLGVPATLTDYFQLTGRQTGLVTTESSVQSGISSNGTEQNLTVITSGTQPADGSLVITLRKNGSNTALTVTIPGGSVAGVYTDNTHTVSLVQGDLINYSVTDNSVLFAGAVIISVGTKFTGN